jgi:hypothetical protein
MSKIAMLRGQREKAEQMLDAQGKDQRGWKGIRLNE